jgi:hypothetical protein
MPEAHISSEMCDDKAAMLNKESCTPGKFRRNNTLM